MLNVKERKDGIYYFDFGLWLIQKDPNWVKENTDLHVEEMAATKMSFVRKFLFFKMLLEIIVVNC